MTAVVENTVFDVLREEFEGVLEFDEFIDDVNANTDIKYAETLRADYAIMDFCIPGIKENTNIVVNPDFYGFDNYDGQDPNDEKLFWNVDFYLLGGQDKWKSYWQATQVVNIAKTIINAINGQVKMPDKIVLEQKDLFGGKIIIRGINTATPFMELTVLDFTTTDVNGIAKFLTGLVLDVLLAYINVAYRKLI